MIVIVAHLTNGSKAYVCQAPIPTYNNGLPIACGDLRLRQRRHLATGFATELAADDWINDAHNKTAFMNANGVSFFSTSFRKSVDR